MSKTIAVILALFVSHFTFAQLNQQVVDSLQKVVNSGDPDTNKVRAYKQLIYELYQQDDTIVQQHYDQGLKLAHTLKDKRGEIMLKSNMILHLNYLQKQIEAIALAKEALVLAKSAHESRLYCVILVNHGSSYRELGMIEEAIAVWHELIDACKIYGYTDLLAKAYHNMGILYNRTEKFGLAEDYFYKAKEKYDRLDKPDDSGYLLMVLSNNAFNTDRYERSLEYATEALKTFRRLENNVNQGYSLNLIGNYYLIKKNYEKAMQYYDSAIIYHKTAGNSRGIAQTISNQANIKAYQGDLNGAIVQYFEAIELYRALPHAGDDYANLCNNISQMYNRIGNHQQAIKYADLVIDSSGTTMLSKIVTAHLNKSDAYAAMGNEKKALEEYKLMYLVSDSLARSDQLRLTSELDAKYENQKKLNAIKLLQQTNQTTAAQLNAEKTTRYAMIGGIISIVVVLALIFLRYRASRKQNILIQQQKDQVELQKAELEERNTEVMDSIAYAERFQKAIFPSGETFEKYLDAGFVMFIPKDVVSGDFFWVEGNDTYSFFAAADCTGHGVPGALVSVMCSNLLHSAVNEYQLSKPGEILDHVRTKLEEKFLGSEDIQDGMDIALCAWNRTSNKLLFAGANNPLYLFQNEALTEIKGDKQPVGKYVHTKPFTTHELNVNPGDKVYLFSDGFPDQFGGPKGKKYKYSNLKKLIQQNLHLPMHEQQIAYRKAYMDWKEGHEQIDDVCLMGVEIPQT